MVKSAQSMTQCVIKFLFYWKKKTNWIYICSVNSLELILANKSTGPQIKTFPFSQNEKVQFIWKLPFFIVTSNYMKLSEVVYFKGKIIPAKIWFLLWENLRILYKPSNSIYKSQSSFTSFHRENKTKSPHTIAHRLICRCRAWEPFFVCGEV